MVIMMLIISAVLTGTLFSERIKEEPGKIYEAFTKRHVSKGSGFSIWFPDQWQVVQNVMGNDIVALAPFVDPEDLFRENANIIHAKLDPSITRENYYSYNINSLTQLLIDFDLEENDEVRLDGITAKRLVFTHTVGIVNAKVMQYLVLDGDQAFVLIFTADSLDFDKIRMYFEQIATSIKFKPEFKKKVI